MLVCGCVLCKAHCAVDVCGERLHWNIPDRHRGLWTRKIFRGLKQNGGFFTSQSWKSLGSWTQPHWPGWMWEKCRRREHNKGKRGSEQMIGSVSIIQRYNLSWWIAFGALRGSVFFFFPPFPECYLHPQSYSQVWCHPSKGACPILSSPWPLMYLSACQL